MTSTCGRIILSVVFSLVVLLVSSCDRSDPPHFELSIDRSEYTAPDTVIFTGSLYGDIDRIVMCDQPVCFCPSVRHSDVSNTDVCLCGDTGTLTSEAEMQLASPFPATCICFVRCNSTRSAERTYVRKQVYKLPGTFKASMTLQSPSGDVFTDTVAVSVR